MSTSRPSISAVPAAARQQQQPVQYFKPKSEWKHQDDASYLYIYLPAFPLEQFTITPDRSNRTVRVEGKRRLPNNRFSPVDETFSIPEDFKLSKMEKQLGRGVLMLKMPRKIVATQVVTEQETVKEIKEETHEPEETVGESMTRKDETSATGLEKKSLDKAAIDRPVMTNMEEKSAMAVAKSDEGRIEENDEASGKPGEQESLMRNDGVKEEENKSQSKEMKGSAMTSAISVAKIEEKGWEKEKSPKSADGGGKEAEKENANASDKKGMVKEMNEDRKLLVNMGAAVLIIMGLGVSLFYMYLK